jgi:hypothetical protein
MDLCEQIGIRSTFFITANHGVEYPVQLARIQVLGQEIGCHGLTHTDEEDYSQMPLVQQQEYIETATRKLEQVTGKQIRSFRSPRVKISASTLNVLAKNGYWLDSSVCSQRMDLVSSNLINFGWLVAPRRAYHPHSTNPYRPGSLPLWEVPVSAAIIPFISSSLKVFGLQFMKVFAWLLYLEARYTGKPLVYLAHPTEFVLESGNRRAMSLADFSPQSIRTHGLLLRNTLFRVTGENLFRATGELLQFLKALPGVTFLTCSEYADEINHQNLSMPQPYLTPQ